MISQANQEDDKRAFLAYQNNDHNATHGNHFNRRGRWGSRQLYLLSTTIIVVIFLTTAAVLYRNVLSATTSTISRGSSSSIDNETLRWQQGYLDLHHIRVGASESTFCIFPDGTTLLIDAGEIDIPTQQVYYPHSIIAKNYPNDLKSTGEWTMEYMQHFWPVNKSLSNIMGLDYVLITHFHEDHIGDAHVLAKASNSTSGAFVRTGITEICDRMPIRTWIDRNYPTYDFPLDMRKLHHDNLNNYIACVEEYSKKGMKVERFKVGSTTQISMMHHPEAITTHFRVKNIKSNLDVWNDTTQSIQKIPGKLLESSNYWDDNFLSSAIVIEYGNFRYYEGGDQDQNGDIDTVTPTAKAAKRVHVATLNNHGKGVNHAFTEILDPSILILQSWVSDQPPDASMDIIAQMKRVPHIFATSVFDERLENMTNANWKRHFQSRRGHVLVRVYPPSRPTGKRQKQRQQEQQQYDIFILNEKRQVESKFGPYFANALIS